MYIFFMVRKFPSVPSFWSFCHKWVLNFVKSFFCIYWDDHIIFIPLFVNCVITLIDLHILKNPCIPGINPTWSRCMVLLMCCWIWFASISLRIFVSMFISDIGLYYSFLVVSLGLVSGWWWACRMSLGVFLPPQFFGKSFRRMCVISSLNVW